MGRDEAEWRKWMNSLGDQLAHGAGLIGVEVGDARDAVGERHPAEVAQVVEARGNVMGRRRGVPGGQHRARPPLLAGTTPLFMLGPKLMRWKP